MTQESGEKQTPADRVSYTGDMSPVIDRLCDVYGVGKPQNFSFIEVGYEDCNIAIETPLGKYVAKIFRKERDHEAIARYTTIMEKVVEAGVSHPTLKKTSEGATVYSDARAQGISMVLMEYVDGHSFLELDRTPDTEELRAVIEQAAKINTIDYYPSYIFDSWAIPNIVPIYERVKEFIEPDDLKLVERAMTQYAEIPIDTLPHCFVHGDFTKANIMKGKDGRIYVLDFSVASWYPRILELAIIVANLLYDKEYSMTLHERVTLVSDIYSTVNPLTPEEKRHLYAYSLAGTAMEFLGSHQEKFMRGNATEETEYWLAMGRGGLRKELGTK